MLGERSLYFFDLFRRHMAAEDGEHAAHGFSDVDRANATQIVADVSQELLFRVNFRRRVTRAEVFIVCAANSIGSRSRSARNTAPSTCQATCRSGPRVSSISPSHVLVICNVRSKTSKPVLMVVSSTLLRARASPSVGVDERRPYGLIDQTSFGPGGH